MTEPVRVVICDDHGIVRSGLRHIIDAETDLTVVGEADDVASAVAVATETQPDVVVMDVGLPDGSGIDAVPEIHRACPAARVVVLTVHDDVAYLRRAFEAGASGYLVKEAADIELVLAIHQVAADRRYVHPALGAALLTPDGPTVRPAGPGGELSKREVEVLRLVALGLTNPQIAEELYVSVRTVETHRAHVYQKLGVDDRAELVRLAREAGLLDHTP